MAGVLSKQEPSPRCFHLSTSCQGKVLLWGGVIRHFMKNRETLASTVEIFDPHLERWEQKPVTGALPPGLHSGACSAVRKSIWWFGGRDGTNFYSSLHQLSMSSMEWRQLEQCNSQDGPIRKSGSAMVSYGDLLAVFGGYGIISGAIQPGSNFINNNQFSDGHGWTNEFHLFDIKEGLWISSPTTGIRPPPCCNMSLTMIDLHRAVLFGGCSPPAGRSSDVYTIDLLAMSWTKMNKPTSAAWPKERSRHAACCLNYGQEHPKLLISGGLDDAGKTLGDAWLLNVTSGTWKEITLPEDMPFRFGHSVTATCLAPGLTAVTMFGGCTTFDPQLPADQRSMIANTVVLTLELVEVAPAVARRTSSEEWLLLSIARGGDLGSLERVGEKMSLISSKMSQLDVRATEERVMRAERLAVEAREEKDQAQQQAQEAGRRALEAEERARISQNDAVQARLEEERAQQETEQARREVNQVQQETEQLREQVLRAERQLAEQRGVEEEPFWVVGRGEIELQEEEELGRGGWAVVKVAKFRGSRVAAKCLHGLLVSDYYEELLIREMNFASRIRHPNLLQFLGATLQGELIILTELMATSVRALMEERATNQQRVSLAEVTSISVDVARALNYLHLMKPDPIIHRDISSANVLLEPASGDNWRAKVSDYGSVNFLRHLATVGPGSPVYAAPEANTPALQSAKMDIFSFGILLLEIAACRFPDPAVRERHIGLVQQPRLVPLIRQCTAEDRNIRPSANVLLAQIELLRY